jgi:MFS family permease
MACFPLLDRHFQSSFPGGLTYVGTFNEGLCTQPLGFILLIVWIAMYLGAITTRWRFVLASLALAGVLLASFFSAVAALPFAFVGLVYELRENDHRLVLNLPGEKLPLKVATLFCSALLCAFWAVPVIEEYPYFATRPLQISRLDVIPPGPWLWIWYGAALGGGVLMLLNGPRKARAFIIGSFGLSLLILASLSPVHWIPSQPPRLLSTLTFLLAVPVGWLLAILIHSLARVLARRQQPRNSWSIAVVAAIASVMIVYVKPGPLDDAVYTGDPSIAGVLHFGRTHQEGRYIVENAWQHRDQHDSRALNAYLGMQGNETLSVVFHESSPSSVFFTPLINALSASVDSFGISSALANDLNFYNQAPEQHLRRAREVGVRYVACLTPWIKRRFRQQADLIEHNLGLWSVFEMKAQVAPEIEILRYLPALVVSSLDLKERQSGSYSFIRLSEEQFDGGYSNVFLVQAETNKIDKLSNLDGFSALILETYDYFNENAAFEVVRRFAQERLVVLVSSDRPLYARLAGHLSELPHALVVRREAEKQSEWLNRSMPWLELDQSRIRKEWRLIEEAIEKGKISSASDSSEASISRDNASMSVRIQNTNGVKVPVLVRMTFHPDWARSDGQRIYPITPFFMLTFASESFEARFRRTGIERAAVAVSAGVFFVLVLAVIAPNRTSKWHRVIRAYLTTLILKNEATIGRSSCCRKI